MSTHHRTHHVALRGVDLHPRPLRRTRRDALTAVLDMFCRLAGDLHGRHAGGVS